MPVSSASSGQHARHRASLNVCNGSWNLPRQPINVDTRRRTMSTIQELDGTGLHERPNWPLPSPPDGREDGVKSVGLQTSPVELEDNNSGDEGAVMGKPEEMARQVERVPYLGDPEVSDMEEEEEDLPYGYGDGDGYGYSNPRSSSTASSSPHLPPQSNYPPRLESYRALHRYAGHDTQADVSPVREERRNQPQRRVQSDDSVPSEASRQTVAQQLARSIINGETEEVNNHGTLDEGDIPIPPGSDSPGATQGQYPSRSPHLNGDTIPTQTTDASKPRSSIAKGPMTALPRRRMSQRSSWISTTQIPSHRNNVRYSWQSIRDEEPNRPRIHIIKLISNTATASAGFPTGEAFGFSISPGGRQIAAFNSARLFVIPANALPVGISQDYALKRRPLAVELTDEGSTLALLADEHTVNIYDLGLQLKRTKTIMLDFPATCIALAPTGGLLAAAYEGGCEVFSLAADALPTDRRAVRSLRMDRMAFSEDGSTLVGTTTRINVSSTVVVQVPVFPASPDNIPTHAELKEAWCSELLHPEIIKNSSHATFMRENRKTCNDKLFAWNGLEDTFGILNVADMQYGKIDFPVVITPPLSTCGGLGAAIHSCPAIDEHGNTAAMIVNDRTIRLYLVPHKVDDEADSVEAHSIDHELDEGYGCPFSEVRWVHSSASLPAPDNEQKHVTGRLIVTSPGGVTVSGISEESVEDIEGGRIILFDFDPQYAGQPGKTFTCVLGKSPPVTLEEEEVNLQDQVSLVRRRTVNQSKSSGLHARPNTIGRSATTYGARGARSARGGRRGPSPAHSNSGSNRNRSSMLSIGSLSDAAKSLPDLMEGGEEADAFEEPYAQGAPRSHASLLRAASNAQRHRFQSIEERNQERASVDSSGDFLPLPEYTEQPNAPLPSRFRALAGLDQPAPFNSGQPTLVVNANGATASSSSTSNPRTAPPDLGESFSADTAFRRANAQARLARQAEIEHGVGSHTMPSSSEDSQNASRMHHELAPTDVPSRTGTYDTTAPVRANMVSAENSRPLIPSGPASRLGTYNTHTTPPGAIGTFNSFEAMPRSLQRAYTNVVSPMVTGPAPTLIGDWRNVSSAIPHGSPLVNSIPSISPTSPDAPLQNEPWDTSTPAGSSQHSGHSYRHSISMPSSSSHPPPPPSSSSSVATTGDIVSATSFAGANIPPHMQAFRAAYTSASLFPPAQPRNQIPVRPSTSRAGTAAHPITGWHPPAASAAPDAALPPASGSVRGRSRKGSQKNCTVM